jgi:hypothetical protein
MSLNPLYTDRKKETKKERDKQRQREITRDVNTNQHTHSHVVWLCSQRDEPPEKILKMSLNPLLGLVGGQLVSLVVPTERRGSFRHEVLAQL